MNLAFNPFHAIAGPERYAIEFAVYDVLAGVALRQSEIREAADRCLRYGQLGNIECCGLLASIRGRSRLR
ncbi:hypothetical protein [Stenotrophomonas muris]|uniref:hypothetical protein n=1 Tax=Stenotrophomonas muris TaxID=2963283 RepID=UPI001E469C8F